MRTALIVDDEPEANKLLSMLVALRGYRTSSAFTGGEALDLLSKNPPDVLLLDLMLPDINGFEVCEAVKTDKATTLIPVVMVTARVAAENRVESYARGADHYVAKPYTPDELFEALDDTEHWRTRVSNPDVAAAGEIVFESSDDHETLRGLARLRSVLFARTPLDLEVVRSIEDSLQSLVKDADAWGKEHRASVIASMAYRVNPDSVSLTIRDASGWIRDDERAPSERWGSLVVPPRFDTMEELHKAGVVTLVKRFKGS